MTQNFLPLLSPGPAVALKAASRAGILSGKGPQAGGSQVEMEALLAQHPAYDKAGAAWLQARAYDCWWKPGHPGWSVWPADSEQFIRGVVEAGDAILAPVQIIAPVPITPHSRYTQGAPLMPINLAKLPL